MMPRVPAVAIIRSGLVTSAGRSSDATCAAIRAKVANPCVTRFIPPGSEALTGYQVDLDIPIVGVSKLAQMAAMAIEEAMAPIPRQDWKSIALLLCVAEPGRPGRPEDLEELLKASVFKNLGVDFADGSAIVAHGRVSLGVALAQARLLLHHVKLRHVVVAAADSLLNWSTLCAYFAEDRLLTSQNCNGFVPGEAAGALLLSAPTGQGELCVHGLGFAMERAHIDSGEPLRGDGLTAAVRAALAEAGCDLCEIDYRVSDLSGEQFYFKEASLALNRILRKRREDFELWHPAECIGEAGASAGLVGLALIHAAHAKGYAPGPRSLLHLSNDSGERAAITTYVI